MGIKVVWCACSQDLYLSYFFLISRVLVSFCKKILGVVAVKLSALAGSIPSSSEFQICPFLQVSEGSASPDNVKKAQTKF